MQILIFVFSFFVLFLLYFKMVVLALKLGVAANDIAPLITPSKKDKYNLFAF